MSTGLLTELPADAVLPQVCTPCMAKLDKRSWHTTLAVRTGPVHTGVRVDTPRAAEALEHLLAPVRVPEMDSRVSPNFSVELGDGREDTRRRSLRLVYRDHEIVGRRRDTDALLLDLLELLDEVPSLAVTEAPVVHASAVLTVTGEAILLPGRCHRSLLVRREQLAEAGVDVLRTRTHRIGTGPAALLLRTHDPALDDILDQHADSRTRAGSFPLATWCVPAHGEEPFDLPASQGVFTAFAMVVNRQGFGAGQTLHSLARVAAETRFVALPELSPGALVSALTRMAT